MVFAAIALTFLGGVIGVLQMSQPSPRLIFGERGQDYWTHACFSTDGRTVLTGRNQLTLWDAQTGKPVKEYRIEAEKATHAIWEVRFSPDGKHVFACGQDLPLVMWDRESGKQIREFSAPPTRSVESFALSRDGKACVTSDFSHNLRLWNVASGELRREATGEGDEIMHLEFNGAGDRILSLRLLSIAIWDSKEMRIAHKMDMPDLPVATRGVIFSPNGRNVLLCTRHGTLLEFDPANAEKKTTYDLKIDQVYKITLNPKGDRLLVGCSNGNVRLYSFPECKELQRITGLGNVQLSADARMAITFTKDGRLMLWDLKQ